MTNGRTSDQLTRRGRIEIVLEEYRSLNTLLLFRLTALDRRLPVSASLFAATFATVAALPNDSKLVFLLTAPLAVLWLVRTTVHHARAKEDHLRRIDEIERMINTIAGQDLLVFQSKHPNHGRQTAGRSGQSTVLATAASGLVMLGICAYFFADCAPVLAIRPYLAYVALIGFDIVVGPISLRQYRYRKASPAPPDIFVA